VGDVVQGNVYRHISFSATGAARMTNAAWAFTTSKTRASHAAPVHPSQRLSKCLATAAACDGKWAQTRRFQPQPIQGV